MLPNVRFPGDTVTSIELRSPRPCREAHVAYARHRLTANLGASRTGGPRRLACMPAVRHARVRMVPRCRHLDPRCAGALAVSVVTAADIEGLSIRARYTEFDGLPRIVENDGETYRLLQGLRGRWNARDRETAVSWSRFTREKAVTALNAP